MLSPGATFGRYRVDDLAATGGMGAVFRATDTVLERPVALKVVLPSRAGEAGLHERLARESLDAAQLNHQHIVQVYDAGEVDGSTYVAMQWIEGRTLEEVLLAGPLAPRQAVDLVEQVADALDCAHRHGLVHRDVKPGNVLVDAGGHAYLTDFGLGLRTDRSADATATGEFMGTADYVAPEQIERGAVDARADVYALGALAFRCLTGHVPFERETPIARLCAHVNDEPPALDDVHPGAPAELDAPIRRALAKAPEHRPATPGELAAALREAIGPDPEAPGATVLVPAGAVVADTAEFPAVERASPSARRRRVLAGAAAALTAAVIGVAASAFVGAGDPTAEGVDSPPPVEARPKDRDRDATPTAATSTGGSDATADADARGRRERRAERRRRRDRAAARAGGGERSDSDPVTGAPAASGALSAPSAQDPSASGTPAAGGPTPAPAPQDAPTGTPPPASQPAEGKQDAPEAGRPPAQTQPAQTQPSTAPSEPPADATSTTRSEPPAG